MGLNLPIGPNRGDDPRFGAFSEIRNKLKDSYISEGII